MMRQRQCVFMVVAIACFSYLTHTNRNLFRVGGPANLSARTLVPRASPPTADSYGTNNSSVFYVLGDSVGRHYAAEMGRKFHASVGSGATVKEQCEKSGALNDPTHVRGSPSCTFGPHIKFAWFQWFAAPATEYTQPRFNDGQGVDVCTPYTDANCIDAATCGFANCLESFLSGASRDSVLVIRGGLQYALFATESFARGSMNTVPLQRLQWADVMRRELEELIALLGHVFPGRVVWVLLSPFSTLDSCKPPLADVGPLVDEVNSVLRSVVGDAGVTIVDPTEFHKGWTGVSTSDNQKGGQGYLDCVHFQSPMLEETVSAVLEAVGLEG